MKKNALGFIALAMALMGNMAMAATLDPQGAIRSIDRCDQYGVVLPAGTIGESLTVGEKAYFRIRLENHNSYDIYRAWQANTELRNAWYFWDSISGQPIDPVQAGIKVGVFVTGRFTLADVLYVTDEPFDPSDGGGWWFTDLICAYTVQPGDLALPMTLANSNKNEANVDDGDTTAYFLGQGLTLLKADTVYQLRSQTHDAADWSTIERTNVCSFKFGDYWSEDGINYLNANGRVFAKSSEGKDYTLFNAGIFIQSIDFDQNTEKDDAGNEVWRAVHERSTSTKEYVPSLMIPGEVADDYAGYVYLWSANTNCVMLPDATIPVNDTLVQKLNFDGSAASLQFRLRGVTQGTTEIFLSSTLTNLVSGSGRTITNFVSRTVACVAPLAPGVNVLANNSPTLQLNATPDYTNSMPFKVELTQAWTNDEPVTVKFKYYLTNSTVAISSADLTKQALIALSDDQQFGYDSILPDSVTIPAGGTDSIELSTNVRALYTLGALTGSNKGDKIIIEPYFENVDMEAFFTAKKPLTLTIYGMKPNILSVNGFNPADLSSGETASALSVRGGVTSEFEVRVSDTYRNMQTLDGSNGYFTVTWQYEGGAKTVITNDVNGAVLLPDGDGILHVPMAYPVPSSDQNMFTTIKVKNADGRESEKSFYVFVKQPKNVTATIGDAAVRSEGANAPVTFTLSETSSSPSLYAYIEPASPAASNLSYAAFFTTNAVETETRGAGGQGIPFASGELVAVSDALIAGNGIKFYDNSSDLFVYTIRLSSSPTWDPSMRLSEFVENQFVITVTNNVPVINLVSGRNASNVDEDMSGTIAMSVGETPRVLRVTDVADVDADLKGTNENQIVYRWAAYKWNKNLNGYPDVPTEVIYTIGLGSTVSITNFFRVAQLTTRHCGLYKFSVRAQDKDMRAGQPEFFWLDGGEWKYNPEREVGGYARANARLYLDRDPNSWGNPYEFQLRIDENPYVFLNPFGNRRSESQTGYAIFSEEDMVAEAEMGFVISLNAMPNTSGFDWIPFKVTVTPEEGVNAAIAPILSETQFEFDATFYSNRFTFLDFDGTWMGAAKNKGGLYRVVAEVSDPTAASEDGTLWQDLYRPCTNYFRLENFKPTVIGDPRGQYAEHNSQTNAVLASFHPAPGDRFDFSWAVSDVDSDMASNLVITCVAGGQTVGVVTNETGSGVFSVWFDRQGSQKLQLIATDKDGDTGYSEWFYFEVQRSKNVRIFPFGPSSADVGGEEADRYSGQPGLGVGRVWADGIFNSIKSYVHLWTYGVETTTANLFAEGYSAGQMDTSTDDTGKSIAPKQNGSTVGTGDERYVNNSLYDSFFYRWFRYEPGKNGGGGNGSNNNSNSGSDNAEWTAGAPKPAKQSATSLKLPMNLEGGTSYPEAAGIAVFSREWRVADNMGDINQDGIPDNYAVSRQWSGGKLYVAAGGGSGGDDAAAGDGSSTSDVILLDTYNGDEDFLPTAWSAPNPLKPSGKTLNWGPGKPFKAFYEIRGMHEGLNEPGVSDYDLSAAETNALFAAFVGAGNDLTGDTATDYDSATNWATTAKWTPDIRLDPTIPDTDDDGFEDGWEYFFWYYAKVGFVDGDGKWGRLEGRRFDVKEPNLSKRISADDVATAFNPFGAGDIGRDFDNDGLTDFEEYTLGTNPVDWDSDGDGMSDYWEVMNGLNPLSDQDAPKNPDGDFMARCDYAEDTFTVFTFANGEIFALPTMTAPSVLVEPSDQTVTNVYEVLAVDATTGETNRYYAIAPVEYDNTLAPPALTSDADCFETVTSDGVVYLKSLTPVTLTAGTEVVSAAADGEDTPVPLISDYRKANVYLPGSSSATTVWFSAAELPALVPQGAAGRKMIVCETTAYLPYENDGTVYLGEKVTLPSGTVVASDDLETSVNMTEALPTGFFWTDPETFDTNTVVKALPVFKYAGDDKTLVPRITNVTIYAVAPVVDDAEHNVKRSPVAKVEENRTLTLLHYQVYAQYGFDPRTAWNKDDSGYLSNRWREIPSSESGDYTGIPTNTVAYTSFDEFWVMQYRRQLREISEDGYIGTKPCLSVLDDTDIKKATTYPNQPGAVSGDSTNDVGQAASMFGANTHGADTDSDGVPDGWELYVNADPNNTSDGTSRKDKDDLSLYEEYAGVDSCNAYLARTISGISIPEAATITRNHPGLNSGWWNKFFPTDPWEADTDGDGLNDDSEGKGWKAPFYVGNTDYGDVSLTFIYDTGDARDSDYTTVCFRGGGLNPCSVDTDGDLLPDAWEYQFAGVLFENGSCKVSLSTNDLATITLADGSQEALSGTEIRGGMDGTWGPYNGANVKGDPCLDFDHDGLLNCQEYLVQSLRHLRYDDMFTPLMGLDPDTKKFVKFVKFSAWDGETFHKMCLGNGFPGLGAWQFSWIGYFTRPPHDWDMLAQNATGKKKCLNYEEAGYRVMLPPHTLVMTMFGLLPIQASGYATTDPRRWDSDEDGIDDYYELFHGLNPLLGSAVSPIEDGEYGEPNIRFDVVASIYGGMVNSWFNNWTDWTMDQPPAFDALRYPWMVGTMECDADGDGLRNDEEAIKVNVASPSNTHTDPTPLWMTDTSGRASFTAQYYAFDPYILEKSTGSALDPYPDVLGFPWEELSQSTRILHFSWAGATKDWMFAFEENEGFDTDHDFRRDSTELVRTVEDASDPLLFADLDRRQALYLPGLVGSVGSAAVSRDGEFRRAISLEPDLLKQFTVECWVKPDGVATNAVIIERICNYGASTLSNNTSVLRANFRVGVDGDGKVYGEFEGSTPDSGSARVTGAVLEADVWTHLAFTFDGSTVKLYVNEDRVPVASQAGVGLIPANGVHGIRQEFGTSVLPLSGYLALPCATVLGARLVGESSLSLSENASWNDFSEYFKGWIDEVRIWDGARTAEQLYGDVNKRYTFEEVKAQRKTVYDAWAKGATRNNADGNENLPAELLQHYNFVSLPGGVTAGNVITEPTGFTRGVLDNVRKPNTESLDEMLVAGWWYRTPVHSTVYWDYHVIPWIGNSVAHLPLMDGSVVDSQYWGLYSAGVLGSYYSEVGKFEFPNSANPYPYYLFRQDRYAHDARLSSSEYLGTAVEKGEGGQLDLVSMYRFQLRSEFVGTSDLVPLGGAFARRGTDFWDASGPMDAWSETKKSAGGLDDSDEDGIPDWAEALGYTTAEDYRLALANGLLPDGSMDEMFKSISDVNRNGVADWWEKYFGVFGQSAWSDADHDGLSLLAEYRASTNDVFGTGEMLDPSLPQSDGRNLDYFRVMANGLYVGEAYADHDFIEDWWEDKYPESQISRNVWDAISDPDRDGWSNFAESRAGTDPTVASVLSIDETELPAYPTPVVEADVSLASGMNIEGTVVVKAWSGSALQGKPDATWSIDTRTDSAKSFSRLLGMNPGTTVTIQLGPGSIVPDTVKVSLCDPVAILEQFNVNKTTGEKTLVGTYAYGTGPWTETLKDSMRNDDPTMGDIVLSSGELFGTVVGSINYRTGVMVVDMTKLYEWQGQWESETDLVMSYSPRSYVKATWSSKMLSGSTVTRLYLVNPDEGHLREGKNTFLVFLDSDGNGAVSDGEPVSVLRDVDVGWSRITDLAFMLSAAAPEGPAFSHTAGATPELVRIVRTAVNGYSAASRVVFSRRINFTGRPYLTLADYVRAGSFDLDARYLTADAEKAGLKAADIRTVDYEVHFGTDATNALTFTKTFPLSRTAPTVVSPAQTSAYRLHAAQPTFVWTGGDDYTAFALEIATNDAPDAVIWSSGVKTLPARTSNGYSFSPAVYVGRELADGTNYFWRVAQFNAKFSTTAILGAADVVWSDWAKFETAVESSNLDTGYGKLKVDVRYYGPENDVGATNVYVEVFKTPDFTGTPVASVCLPEVELADLALTNVIGFTSVQTNNLVVIDGIPAGSYYVRAFIDRNGNGLRDAYEAWGYANQVGTDRETLYTPVAVPVSVNTTDVSGCVVFMEDTDVNQNATPDCWEDVADLERAVAVQSTEASSSADLDRDGLSDAGEDEFGTESTQWDSDGDGMPDGWEAMFGYTDPITADADLVVDGDVMAYAVTNATVITVWDGVDERSATNRYVVLDPLLDVAVGADVSGLADSLAHTYDYAGQYGLGQNAIAADLAGLKVYVVEPGAEIVLVHAQVYEAFGFNPNTANPTTPAENRVNTKPFTAIDKYLVCRYLEKVYGLADETAMNTNREWSAYTLKPGDPDNNKDGIPDGWELYVMFGNGGAVASLGAAKITPFMTGPAAAEYVRDAANTPDNGGLSILGEYDGGRAPTDPWQLASLALGGIDDKTARQYHIMTVEAQLADDDNDGLSNWAEYLAAKAGYGDFKVDDPYSVNGNVLDYFVKTAGGLYVGEALDDRGTHLIADHDFMEDAVEDELGFNRYSYDAHRDADGNGWDNWSEVRARYNKDTWVQIGAESNAVQKTFYREWRVDQVGNYYLGDSPDYVAWQATNTEVIIATKYMMGNGEIADRFDGGTDRGDGGTIWVGGAAEYRGRSVDRYTFIAYVITILETTPVMDYGGRPRPNIALKIYGFEGEASNLVVRARSASGVETTLSGKGAATPDGTFTGVFTSESIRQGLNTLIVTAGDKIGIARDVDVGYNGTSVEVSMGANDLYFNVGVVSSNMAERVSIVRIAINGRESSRRRTLWSKIVSAGEELVLTPADLVKRGEVDFDGRYLRADAEAEGIAGNNIRTVQYGVFAANVADPIYTFERSFSTNGAVPTPADSYENLGYKVLSAQPELVWMGAEGYPSFVLQIAADPAFSSVVYATTNASPVVRSDGYHFRPGAYVGRELADSTKYYWRVAQLNAKFSVPVWSVVAEFETAVNVDNANTGYGRVAADVRYYGPATVGNVVVGAYASPDFVGAPSASKVLAADVTSLAYAAAAGEDWMDVHTNVVLEGLAPGDWYVMAFVDSNTNGVRDAYETWGYVCKFATGAADRWTPAALTAVMGQTDAPSALLIMEDTDVNQNMTPDCIEDMTGWSYGTFNGGKDADADGLSESEETEFFTDAAIWDTDGDGMPDGWEVKFAGTDSLTVDGDMASDSDVMAYAVTNLTVVTVWDGVNESSATNRYVILDPLLKFAVGDDASGLADSLWRTYDYAGQYGLGMGATAAELAGLKIYAVEANVEVVLVHAQVYDVFGFDPTTANPMVIERDGTNYFYGVNTKPFTAIDKYLVCRYLENVYGLADETAMNTNREWAAYTLKPGDPDNNKDGIPDGWELYTMFGNGGAVATLADAKVSPFVTAEYVRDAANTPDGGGLTILEEYDGGNTPTDPWQLVSLPLDGLTDEDAYRYQLKTAESQLADDDNDGLSNWAEYLAGTTVSMTNAYTSGTVLDYFQRVTQDGLTSYLGWFYADHDFIEDLWEDEYDVDVANRYVYDSRSDRDGDGWSNYAEARAGTDPSRSVSLTVDGATVAEHPVPVLQIGFRSPGNGALNGNVVLQAYRAGATAAEAEWKISLTASSASGGTTGDSATNSSVKVLGAWRPGATRFTFSPSSVRPGSVRIEAKDLSWYYVLDSYNWNDPAQYGDSDWNTGASAAASWEDIIYDMQRPDDPLRGDLVYKTGGITTVVGWVDYESGQAEIDFSLVSGYFYRQDAVTIGDVSGSSSTSGTDSGDKVVYRTRRYDLTASYFRAMYVSEFVSQGANQKFYFSEPDSGILREGRHDFFAFADLDGNGEYSPGEPSGFVRGVDVGWDRVPDMYIELKGDSPIFPAFAVASSNTTERVRIYRTSLNGENVRRRLVWRGDVDASQRSWLSEMDFVGDGAYDFDWQLASEVAALYGIAPAELNSVGYTVYVGRGTNAVEYAQYEKRFGSGVLVPIAPSEGSWYLVHTAQPEFKWSGSAGRPAYVLQVASDEGFANLVYAETNFMPAVTSEGYVITPALWVGDQLADGTDYFWRVAAIDARNADGGVEPTWSSVAKFKTDVDSTDRDTGYGKLGVEVRYYGASSSASLSDVVVAAYTTADFSGTPVARTHLSDSVCSTFSSLAVTSSADTFMTPNVNVCFDGLAPGNYYVMAFIDLNGNGRRDPWESWGYINKVGTDSAALYTPVALTVSSAKIDVPAGVLFMEDTDVNQNGVPDCEEDQEAFEEIIRLEEEAEEDIGGSGSSGGSGSGSSGGSTPSDPSGDEDRDGIPDGWEDKNGLDPDDPEDENFAVEGDVMAYAVTNLTLITVWDGVNPSSATNKFIVRPESSLNVGDDVSSLTNLWTIYDYNGTCGLGRRAAASELAGLKVYNIAPDAEVVLVHAQVYEAFGFSSYTANPTLKEEDRVNTKPFTAIDKYLVCRYLENVYGLADEAAMATNGQWSAYTLKPGDPDNNKDGIPDGWELYTMFGTNAVPVSLADDGRVSPFATINANGVPVLAADYVRDPANTPDGACSLSILEKYDGGRTPLDPWKRASAGLGDIDDKTVIEYHLKGEEAPEDFDGDSLPNYAEYLITNVFQFAEVNPDSAYTADGQLEYFLKVGKLYLGEIFTDHDFMEDDFEREWSEVGADTAVYDAHIDADEDGWSNWAEIRAMYEGTSGVQIGTRTNQVQLVFDVSKDPTANNLFAATNQQPLVMTEFYTKELGWTVGSTGGTGGTTADTTNAEKIRYTMYVESPILAYAGHPTPEVSMTVRYNGLTPDLRGRLLTVQAFTDEDLKVCDATFTVQNGAVNRNVNTLTFSAASAIDGYLREGKNTFVVTAGSASNETESAGLVMGVVRNVDVGWSKVEFEVELTATTPICPRPSLESALAGSADSGFSSATESGLDMSHVYVYRCTVDDEPKPALLLSREVLSKDVGDRSYLHEGDFLADDKFDIDWSNFQREVVGTVPSEFPVTSVTYRAYFEPVNVKSDAVWTNSELPYVQFTREFGRNRATAVPVAPGEDSTIIYGARPTFKWKMTGDRPDTYTAFAIQIKSGSTVIWNSGVQVAPARDMDGNYQWMAPIYPGDQTSLGKVFANTNNYTWQVTMYNAKFQRDSWSDARSFRVNVYAEDELNNAGYYGIKADVKYYGPSELVNVDPTKTNNILRVEAYTSPDFSGEPAARTFVRNLSSLTNTTEGINATLVGLRPGKYYLCAFLDSDGDFKRSAWESWGYVCPRAAAVDGAGYAPTAIEIGAGIETPVVRLYVEDADTDQDCLPDAWEYKQWEAAPDGWAKDEFYLKNGPMENNYNGYISVNPDLVKNIPNLGTASSLAGAASPGRLPKTLAALAVGADVADPAIDGSTLKVSGLSLKGDTVTLTVSAEAEDPFAGTAFVSAGAVTVKLVVKSADSLDGEWKETEVEKTFKITEGEVSETFSFSLSELGLDASKGFFKVEIK